MRLPHPDCIGTRNDEERILTSGICLRNLEAGGSKGKGGVAVATLQFSWKANQFFLSLGEN